MNSAHALTAGLRRALACRARRPGRAPQSGWPCDASALLAAGNDRGRTRSLAPVDDDTTKLAAVLGAASSRPGPLAVKLDSARVGVCRDMGRAALRSILPCARQTWIERYVISCLATARRGATDSAGCSNHVGILLSQRLCPPIAASAPDGRHDEAEDVQLRAEHAPAAREARSAAVVQAGRPRVLPEATGALTTRTWLAGICRAGMARAPSACRYALRRAVLDGTTSRAHYVAAWNGSVFVIWRCARCGLRAVSVRTVSCRARVKLCKSLKPAVKRACRGVERAWARRTRDAGRAATSCVREL